MTLMEENVAALTPYKVRRGSSIYRYLRGTSILAKETFCGSFGGGLCLKQPIIVISVS